MSITRLPRWLLWTGLTIAVWLVWLTVLRAPMTTMVTELEREKIATERRLEELKARLDHVPVLVSRLDSTYTELVQGSRSVARVANIDLLVTDLRNNGSRWGLHDVSVEPDLGSLLSIGHALEPTNDAIRLDTLLVDLAGNSDFISSGHWMDAIEARPDFQQWVDCHWVDPDGDGRVEFAATVALLVINGPESIEPLIGSFHGDD